MYNFPLKALANHKAISSLYPVNLSKKGNHPSLRNKSLADWNSRVYSITWRESGSCQSTPIETYNVIDDELGRCSPWLLPSLCSYCGSSKRSAVDSREAFPIDNCLHYLLMHKFVKCEINLHCESKTSHHLIALQPCRKYVLWYWFNRCTEFRDGFSSCLDENHHDQFVFHLWENSHHSAIWNRRRWYTCWYDTVSL